MCLSVSDLLCIRDGVGMCFHQTLFGHGFFFLSAGLTISKTKTPNNNFTTHSKMFSSSIVLFLSELL